MRRGLIGILLTLGLLLPQGGSAQGERARVGAKTVGDLEISLYMWGPQEIVAPKSDPHHLPGEKSTHHFDVRVYDLRRRIYIPYLTIKATITDRLGQQTITLQLDPMIGEWIHYGANVTFPRPGSYSILIDVQPPDIARYKHLADVWNTPAQAVFTYEYR